MADALSFGGFRVDRAGVAATLKQGGVAGWVAEEAGRLAASANEAARRNLTARDLHIIQHYEPGVATDAPYEAVVKAGNYDTLGVVRPANLWGRYDQNQHHTLDGLNH